MLDFQVYSTCILQHVVDIEKKEKLHSGPIQPHLNLDPTSADAQSEPSLIPSKLVVDPDSVWISPLNSNNPQSWHSPEHLSILMSMVVTP